MAFASQKLAAVISCHAWDNACLRLAICPNNHEVHLYAAPDLAQPWQRTAVLSEHDQLVSGLDWSRSDQLVSCSHDRNAYVWTCTDGHWRPEMVSSVGRAWLACTVGLRARIVLCSLWMATSALPVAGQVVTRLELAALCVRWSPCGRKFAIGAAKTVCVAYRDGDKGWWVAKLMRRCHSSSVMAVAWHPSGALLATASSDGRCRVFIARVAGTLSVELMTETALNITNITNEHRTACTKMPDVSVTARRRCSLVRRSALGCAG